MNSFLDGEIHSDSIRVVGERRSWRWNEDEVRLKMMVGISLAQ